MSEKAQIIGICGGSGSGKTTFLSALKERLSERSITYISLDDYYIPREEQKTDEKGIKNFDLPTAIDDQALVSDLKRLLDGESVEKPKYTFNSSTAKPSTFTLESAKLYVIEGLFIYHYEELAKMFDLKIYIDVSNELKIIRRIKRDQAERNYPLEDVLYRYENHVLPSYEKYIGVYKSEADLIINNFNGFEKGLEVVTNHIKALTPLR